MHHTTTELSIQNFFIWLSHQVTRWRIHISCSFSNQSAWDIKVIEHWTHNAFAQMIRRTSILLKAMQSKSKSEIICEMRSVTSLLTDNYILWIERILLIVSGVALHSNRAPNFPNVCKRVEFVYEFHFDGFVLSSLVFRFVWSVSFCFGCESQQSVTLQTWKHKRIFNSKCIHVSVLRTGTCIHSQCINMHFSLLFNIEVPIRIPFETLQLTTITASTYRERQPEWSNLPELNAANRTKWNHTFVHLI